MKILVCFKTVIDYSMIPEKEWVVQDDNSIDMSFARQEFNCFDESALEIGLKLSDRLGCAELSALTIDDRRADLFLKQLYAVGYNNAVRVYRDEGLDLRFNGLLTSKIISSYVERYGGHQLVLLGKQGAEGDNRQTGPLVAEQLGWPFISDVVDVEVDDTPGVLRITKHMDGVNIIQKISVPIVLAIGNSINSPCLRVPTLKQKLIFSKKQVDVIKLPELGIDPGSQGKNDKTLISLDRIKPERNVIIINGKDAKEKAGRMYELYLRERLNL